MLGEKNMNTKINVGLLLKVADQITKHPEQFRMSVFDCKTAACIGGWAERLSGNKINEVIEYGTSLGLSHEQKLELFIERNWPRRFRSDYGGTPEALAAKAVLRIHAFLDDYAPGWRETRPELTSSTEADAAVATLNPPRTRE